MSHSQNKRHLEKLKGIAEALENGMKRMSAVSESRKEAPESWALFMYNTYKEHLEELTRRIVSGLGEMPIKGIDYFTNEEIDDFLQRVTPIKGKEYFTEEEIDDFLKFVTPKKGVDYFDGKDGIGKIGPRGPAGKDGIANMDEVQELTGEKIDQHETRFDHKLLHDPHIVGTKTVDESNAAEGRIQRLREGKLVYEDLPDVKDKLAYLERYMRGISSTTSARYRIRTVTASYTLDPLDNVVHIDSSAGNVTITLYPASGNEGSHTFLKRIDNTLTNTVEFATSSGETIDWDTLYQLVNRGSGAEVYSDGTNFFIKHA